MAISYNNITIGQVISLGQIVLTEQEIINYAKEHDPLPFHVDKIAAQKSIFKGLVASGPHIFQSFHKNKWIPLFGNTVIAGLEVNNWKFLKPVYANQLISCDVAIMDKKINSNKTTATVKWLYEFKDVQSQELVQCLEMTILHTENER